MNVRFWSNDIVLFSYYFVHDVRDTVISILSQYILECNVFSISPISYELGTTEHLYQTGTLMDVYTVISVHKQNQLGLDLESVSELIQSFLNYQAAKPLSRM